MRALIVDDNQMIRRLLRRTIEKKTSFEIVGEACDGADAIEATERLHPDVVILDINMPVMDGVEAAPLIKRAFPAIRIIVCTSNDASRVAGLVDEGVIVGYVYKTATDDLVNQLNDVVSRCADENSVLRVSADPTLCPATLPEALAQLSQAQVASSVRGGASSVIADELRLNLRAQAIVILSERVRRTERTVAQASIGSSLKKVNEPTRDVEKQEEENGFPNDRRHDIRARRRQECR